MVALYFPTLTAPNPSGFGFYDYHTSSFMFGEDCSNLDPYPYLNDLDNLIPPPSFYPSIPIDPLLPGLSSPAWSPEEATVAGNKNKKQSHNASERLRRMKINGLYASLRALLPNSDHMKKLSIPNTVDRVVKYIPELQMEVEGLLQRKEQLQPALDFSKPEPVYRNEPCCSSSVQATELGNGEVSVQISTPKTFITTLIPISEILRELEEEEGLFVIDASCSESAAGTLFHHFHLMAVEASQKVIKCELLKVKLLSLCQKWEQLCLWMISQGLSST